MNLVDDVLILLVFPLLDVVTLVRAFQVCQDWNRISWKTTRLDFSSAGPKLRETNLKFILTKTIATQFVFNRYEELISEETWNLFPTKLESLKFTKCPKINAKFLSNFTSLTKLNFKECPRINSTVADFLPSNLKCLGLDSCMSVNDDTISQISQKYTSLEKINLKGCFKLTERSLMSISESLTNLKSLNVSKLKNALTSTTLNRLTNSCKNIQCLNLIKCRISDEDMNLLAERLAGKLKVLKVKFCTNLTDASIIKICQNCCNSLEYLDIQGITAITNNVMPLISTCTKLQILDLRDLPNINDGTELIANNCNFIREIHLRSPSVNDDMIIAFANKSLSLWQFDIQGCANVTMRGIIPLLESPHIYLKLINLTEIDFTEDQINTIQNTIKKAGNTWRAVHISKRDTKFSTRILQYDKWLF